MAAADVVALQVAGGAPSLLDCVAADGLLLAPLTITATLVDEALAVQAESAALGVLALGPVDVPTPDPAWSQMGLRLSGPEAVCSDFKLYQA